MSNAHYERVQDWIGGAIESARRGATGAVVLALAFGLSACDDTAPTGPGGPGGDGQGLAMVAGSVEQTSQSSSLVSFSSATQRAGATGSASAAVASVGSGGSLETRAEAGGTFRIEGVPAGCTDLVVAGSEHSANVGRALLHGTTRAGVEAVASFAEVETALQSAADSWQQVIFEGVLGLVSDLGVTLKSEIESELETAFTEADLAAVLEGAASASAAGETMASYRSDVDAAQGDAVSC